MSSLSGWTARSLRSTTIVTRRVAVRVEADAARLRDSGDLRDSAERNGTIERQTRTRRYSLPSWYPAERLDNLTQAARVLLDPDFVILPEFTLTEEAANEFRNAWDHRTELLQYLENDLHKDFPVDEWLYGVGRVRDKIKQLEASIMLMEALNSCRLERSAAFLTGRLFLAWIDSPTRTRHRSLASKRKAALSACFAENSTKRVRMRVSSMSGRKWFLAAKRRPDVHFDMPNTDRRRRCCLRRARFEGSGSGMIWWTRSARRWRSPRSVRLNPPISMGPRTRDSCRL